MNRTRVKFHWIPDRGSATVEYVLVTLLVVIILIASPSVITQLIDAIKQLYQAFTVAIGRTYAVPDDPAFMWIWTICFNLKQGF